MTLPDHFDARAGLRTTDLTGKALLDAFQRATRLKVELDMTPRWRWRKRERLETSYDVACLIVDEIREAMGAPADAPGLAQVIAAQESSR